MNFRTIAYVFVFFIAKTASVSGQWSSDSSIPNEFCTAPDLQYAINYSTDKTGNIYTIWADYRNGKAEIFVQKTSILGQNIWGNQGIKVGTIMNFVDYTYTPKSIESDENGGATVIWHKLNNRADLTERIVFGNYVNQFGELKFGQEGLALSLSSTYSDDPNSCVLTGYKTSESTIAFVYDVANKSLNEVNIVMNTVSDSKKIETKTLFTTNTTGSKFVFDNVKKQFFSLEANSSLGYSVGLFDVNGNRIKESKKLSNDNSTSKHRIDYYKVTNSELFIGRTLTLNGVNSVFAHKFNSNLDSKWGEYGLNFGVSTAFDIQLAPNSDGGAILAWIEPNDPKVRLKSARINSSGNSIWSKDVFTISNSKSHIIPNKTCSDNADGMYLMWFTSKPTGFNISMQHLDKNGNLLFKDTDDKVNQFNFFSDYRLVSHPYGGTVVLYGAKKDLNNDIAVNVNLFTNYINQTGNYGYGSLLNFHTIDFQTKFCAGESFSIIADLSETTVDLGKFDLLFSSSEMNFENSKKTNFNQTSLLYTIPIDAGTGQYYLKLQNKETKEFSVNTVKIEVVKLVPIEISTDNINLCSISETFSLSNANCLYGNLQWYPEINKGLKLGENVFESKCIKPGCIDSQSSKSVFVNVSNIVATVNSSISIYEGEDLKLSVAGGVKYEWVGPNNFKSSEANPIINKVSLQNGGIYKLEVFDKYGCSKVYNVDVKINQVLSNEPVHNSTIILYPNPSINGKLYYSFPNSTLIPEEILVYDKLGKLINTFKISLLSKNSFELPKGNYLIKIKKGNTITTKNIIVE